MICPNCGQSLNDTAKFCVSCGTPAPQGLEQPQNQTPHLSLPQQQTISYETAEYGVPHCLYTKTDAGFTASFSRPNPIAILALLVAVAFSFIMVPILFVAQSAAGSLFLILACVILFFFVMMTGNTTIEVTGDSVIINGRALRRKDFGVFGTAQIGRTQLSYSYGLRSFEFGGFWGPGKAAEVANALNIHLRQTPTTFGELYVSPEDLRSARPNVF